MHLLLKSTKTLQLRIPASPSCSLSLLNLSAVWKPPIVFLQYSLWGWKEGASSARPARLEKLIPLSIYSHSLALQKSLAEGVSFGTELCHLVERVLHAEWKWTLILFSVFLGYFLLLLRYAGTSLLDSVSHKDTVTGEWLSKPMFCWQGLWVKTIPSSSWCHFPRIFYNRNKYTSCKFEDIATALGNI